MQRTETQTTLPDSARRVQDYLREHGFDCIVIELPNSTWPNHVEDGCSGTTCNPPGGLKR